jgi:thiamine biosynthesis lipoprotein
MIGRYFIVVALLVALVSAQAWRLLRTSARTPMDRPAQIAVGGMTMGGTWSVKLPQLLPAISKSQLETEIGQLLDRLDGQMSLYRPESDLCKFNRYRGAEWFNVPTDLVEVVAESLRVSEQTGGAFDITVAPLVNLWGFGPAHLGGQHGKTPDKTDIATARAHVGYRRLECRLNPPALRKSDPELSIDLGGIGKGFAADKVSAYLDRLGARDYLVAIGGELRARGSSSGSGGWRVGIETPTPDTRRIFRQIDLRNASLSTSGDYRNFFEIDGHRFSHEIDPHTGRPVEHGPASVSIVHASGTYADAMATALMVLAPDESFALAKRRDLAVLFVFRGEGSFETHETPAFERLTKPK